MEELAGHRSAFNDRDLSSGEESRVKCSGSFADAMTEASFVDPQTHVDVSSLRDVQRQTDTDGKSLFVRSVLSRSGTSLAL